MLAALLALAASAAYGSSDVAAGVVSRRASPLAVAWWTHVLGAAVVLALALAGRPERAGLVLGLAAGAVLTVGLLLYYGALSRGQVSLITPLAATGVVVPVLVGLARGEAIGPLAWVGLVVAAAGVLVVARQQGDDDRPSPPSPGARPGCSSEQRAVVPRLAPIPTALLAALAFGSSLVLVDASGSAGASPLWVAAGLQVGGLAALVPVVLTGARARVGVPRGAVPLVAAAGLLVAGADVALAAAFAAGDLAVVSVLASLDSVASVALAQVLLRERLRHLQALGVAAALGGAVLLAAG